MAVLTKITQRSLADNAVTSAHVQGDVIAAGDIAAGAVGSSELAADAVIAGKVADGAIDVAAALGSNVVTQSAVADDAIGADELAANAVVDASVASGAAIAVGKLAGTASRALETSGTGAVQVSATTTTELAKIAGLTASTAELNKTAGLTPTTAELNILDGSASGPLQNRNMIINGGMQVWQRATAATGAGNAYNTADRYQWINNTDGNFTSERYTMTLPELNTTGHGYAAKLVCIGVDAGTTAAGHYGFMRQRIEAQNLQQLQYGTANAKTMTLSFWVKSSMTGAYNVALIKDDSTSYYIPIEYTISSADTWEKKTITITPTAGSTSLITGAAGIINNDNGTGFHLDFILSCGSTYHGTTNTWTASVHLATSNQVNWLDSTSSRTFYITGIQLELGSNATPFEHRSYGDEYRRCQRYFQKYKQFMTPGFWNGTQNIRSYFTFHTPLRASPTLTEVNGSGQKGGGASSLAYQTSGSAASVAATMDNNTVYLSRSGFTGGSDMKGVNHLHQNWENWFTAEL